MNAISREITRRIKGDDILLGHVRFAASVADADKRTTGRVNLTLIVNRMIKLSPYRFTMLEHQTISDLLAEEPIEWEKILESFMEAPRG